MLAFLAFLLQIASLIVVGCIFINYEVIYGKVIFPALFWWIAGFIIMWQIEENYKLMKSLGREIEEMKQENSA